ncbi:MFS transporter [Streptomyces sp. NPDC018711]|uniref:MFS transporter n=1 Tax=Streptomyces sp. NPDC018711 TaxID=3365052 RepID=UPI0037A91DF9
MLSVLRNRTYRRLFCAQVVALAGTGLATVALSLLAYDLAGADATAVLGTALALKMAAYVTIAPLAGALADRVPRRALLVSMDLARATVVLALPFVTQVWQVYVLILLLQAASATFTPAFQATIPQVLPGERDYTEALSLSRLAYDLESLASPVLAAALLAVVPYDWLFAGTTTGFLASALLVRTTTLPTPPEHGDPGAAGAAGAGRGSGAVPATGAGRGSGVVPAAGAGRGSGVVPAAGAGRGSGAVPATGAGRGSRAASAVGRLYAKVAFGVRLVLATPRLRALLALDLAVAAAGAVVLVDTVLLVRDTLGRPAGDVPFALGAYGAGSMAVALLLPRVLGRADDRAVMVRAAFVLPGALVLLAVGLATGARSWPALLAVWLVVGAAGSAVLTPGGRVVRRSADGGDLPAAFAARFSLSHACWLLAYPLAGGLAAWAGPAVSAAVLAALALVGAVGAAYLWPREDPAELEHVHPELPAGHPHLAGSGGRHAHAYHIDALHRRWPTPSGQRGSRISRPSRTTSRP